MFSFLPSVVALGLLAIVAAYATLIQPISPGPAAASASRMLMLATVVQAVHFAEEWAFDFHIHFPALFDLAPMPLWLFVSFNLACLLGWALSIATLGSARKLALFGAWFLALAGVMNAIAHPLMALAVDAYFPGLVTAPLIGAAAAFLAFRLRQLS